MILNVVRDRRFVLYTLLPSAAAGFCCGLLIRTGAFVQILVAVALAAAARIVIATWRRRPRKTPKDWSPRGRAGLIPERRP